MKPGQTGYHIVDEPRVRVAENLLINPLIILLVSIFLPLMWNPPFWGRFWIPFVWIMLNSFFLGSPTFWKELLISILGVVSLVFIFFGVLAGAQFYMPENVRDAFPYLRILMLAVFYLFLYWVVFLQMTPWNIYEYIKNQR